MIKNKFKLGLALLAVLAIMISSTGAALAVGEVVYSADTTYTFTGGDVTVLSGSKATSVANSATAFTITITNPDIFTVRSANKFTFAVVSSSGATYTSSCGSTFSEVAIAPASGVTETGLTITPNTTACASVSGGGTGAGGAGGGATTDTTAPASASVTINGGAAVTTSPNVTLTLAASDATGVTNMMISNDAGFAGAIWEAYATSKAWTLTSGNGVKTVYAKFNDAAGNVSAVVSDTITLDSAATDVTPPSLPAVSINGGADVTGSQTVTLTLSANDPSGVTHMMISNDANFTGGAWETFMTSKSWVLPGPDGVKVVYAKFRDSFGNISATVSDSITLQGGFVSPPSTPPTQAQIIAQLQLQINALILQINALVAAQGGVQVSGCPVRLSVNLSFGMRHSQVTCLQRFLFNQGDFTNGFTGYFGVLTRAAVQKYQVRKGITVVGGAGYGMVGPRTRASINAQLGF